VAFHYENQDSGKAQTLYYSSVVIPAPWTCFTARLDNLLEDLHCQMMRVYSALDDRAGLIRQYQELSDVLASEMGIEPLPTTKKLYDRLLIGMKG
jgi:hypothetical protein